MNRLAGQKSPYLLQHQHNPVDWFPWGSEAFEKASQEQKPIFLSIGYATCHWCHVMERESFENEATARFLNAHVVCIKVDREERPDVDHLYMGFVQATAGNGGWPLNVFLTPDRKPFFGGTYFPPDRRYGKPAFMDVLQEVQRAWTERRSEILCSAEDIFRHLTAAGNDAVAEATLAPAVLARAAAQLKTAFDPVHGGFGSAPKFPQPGRPRFLLAHGVAHGDAQAVDLVLRTCDAMAAGGIHDQLGGGFARYATDAAWQIPHFEKMLYDNAQLARLYLDVYRVSGEPRHAAVVRGILDYVLRDMTHAAGGFFSAEDADSEGQEGKFYCWTQAELAALLTTDEFAFAVRRFGVTERGNFLDHSHPTPLPDQNVLHVADRRLEAGDAERLTSVTAKLLAARNRRIRPQKDDKILAAWNGLMLGAFAEAGVVFSDDTYRQAARRNAVFIRSHLWEAERKVLHSRWRDGERDDVQLLSAYACVLAGMIDLYETTLDEEDLEFGVEVAESLLAQFHDLERGGFWQSPADADDLIFRAKDDYDGAEPAGNSVATLALLKLAAITGRDDFRKAAEAALRLYSGRLADAPLAIPYLAMAAAFWLEPPRRVVIAGHVGSEPGRALLQAAHAVYQPFKIVLGTCGPVEEMARAIPRPDSGSVACICLGTSCRPPVRDPAALRAALSHPRKMGPALLHNESK